MEEEHLQDEARPNHGAHGAKQAAHSPGYQEGIVLTGSVGHQRRPDVASDRQCRAPEKTRHTADLVRDGEPE